MTKESEKFQKGLLIIYVTILVLGLIFLSVNLDVVSVIHSRMGMLWVITYETYSSIETSLFYFLVVCTLVNIFLLLIKKVKVNTSLIIALISIFALIIILLFILNPHSIILFPIGAPPTRLDYINIGGYIGISLYGVFILINFIYLILEGKFSRYTLFLLIIIGVLFLSDFIHELGHATFVLLSGGEITEFYPFPVLLGGEFAAGYVGFQNVPSNLVPLVLLGGEIFQWIVLSSITLILWRFKPKGKLRIFLILLLLIAWLDFPLYTINNAMGIPHWFLIGGIEGDIITFCANTGFPLYIMIILASIQLILGIILIWKLKIIQSS